MRAHFRQQRALRGEISDFNSECRALNHVLVEPDFVNVSTLPGGYPPMCYTLTEVRWSDFSLHTCTNIVRIRRCSKRRCTQKGRKHEMFARWNRSSASLTLCRTLTGISRIWLRYPAFGVQPARDVGLVTYC